MEVEESEKMWKAWEIHHMSDIEWSRRGWAQQQVSLSTAVQSLCSIVVKCSNVADRTMN